MANIKSAKKRVITSEKARRHNASRRSMMRTLFKKTVAAIEAGDTEAAPDWERLLIHVGGGLFTWFLIVMRQRFLSGILPLPICVSKFTWSSETPETSRSKLLISAYTKLFLIMLKALNW